jgi:hypothetical protein
VRPERVAVATRRGSLDAGGLFAGWSGAAVGAAAAFASVLILGVVVNVCVIAGVSGARFNLSAVAGVLLYGGLGIGSVGKVSAGLGGLSTSVHYSLSLTLLGALLLMLAALAAAGWTSSRLGSPTARGTLTAGAKAAALFALLMFLGSFLFQYSTLHPQHLESLLFPVLWGLPFCWLGARIEREGYRFWQPPATAFGPARPQLTRAAFDGLTAVGRMLLVTAAASVVGLALLAVEHPHQAGSILGGRQIVTEILLIPLWLPHLIALVWLAAQGIAFHFTILGGTDGINAANSSANVSTSILGGQHDAQLPAYVALLVLIPLACGLRSGYLIARRHAGTTVKRVEAAMLASVAFLLVSWLLAIFVGIKASLGLSFLSAEIDAGPTAAAAIFWPLLWGPLVFAAGALVQAWRADDLASTVTGYEEPRATDAATTAPAPQDSAERPASTPIPTSALAAPPTFCQVCGNPHTTGNRFCAPCSQTFAD